MTIFDPAMRPDLWWHDLSKEEVAKWDATVKSMAIGVFWTPIAYAGWRYLPSTFIMASRDRALPPAMAQQQIDFAKAQTPTGLDTV